MNEREVFLKAAVAGGCPEDQTRNLVAAQLWLQERQLATVLGAGTDLNLNRLAGVRVGGFGGFGRGFGHRGPGDEVNGVERTLGWVLEEVGHVAHAFGVRDTADAACKEEVPDFVVPAERVCCTAGDLGNSVVLAEAGEGRRSVAGDGEGPPPCDGEET